MNLKRMQSFVLVTELRSFSEAADRAGMTQSAISRQIQALEEEIGLPLLARKPGTVELTPAGRDFYAHARRWIGEWNAWIEQCARQRNEWSGELRIGASTIPSVYLLPACVQSFRTLYPRVALTVAAGTSADILSRLASKQLDVAIVGSTPDSSLFAVHPIAEDRLVVIGAADEPPMTGLRELKSRPVVLREEGSGTREAFESLLASQGMSLDELQIAAQVNSTEAAIAMVEAGVGVSVVSALAARGASARRLAPLLECATDRMFSVVHPMTGNKLPLVRLFVDEAVRLGEAAR